MTKHTDKKTPQRRALYDHERKLAWRAKGMWVAKTDESLIIVSEEIYDHYLNAYLERLDVKRTTWTEIMQAAKNVQSGMEEWKRYCEIIDRFQADLDPWLQRKESGVRIYPRTD